MDVSLAYLTRNCVKILLRSEEGMKKKANRLIRKNAGITPVGACPPKANVIEKLDASSGAKKHGRAGTGVNFSKKAQKM